MVRVGVILHDVEESIVKSSGLFFYKSDFQEIDIEYLTDPNSLANDGPYNAMSVWYTNQATDPTSMPATRAPGLAPFNCTSREHEYRIDWTSDYTVFYIDGQLQQHFTSNVPSQPGPWVWNNWANGDVGTCWVLKTTIERSGTRLTTMRSVGWSVGPPRGDSLLQIQSITMYYNTAG